MAHSSWIFFLVCVTYAHCDKLHTADASAPSSNCDKGNCPIYFKHLKGKCEPIYEGSCCPIAFDCSQEKQPRDKSYCISNGKKYEAGTTIDNVRCALCSCVPRAINETSVSCNGVDCPSVFMRPAPGDDCVSVSVKGACCGRRYCGEEKKKLPQVTCEHADKVYKYGQTFYPEMCTSCVCNEHWDGDITNNKTCSTTKCNFDIDVTRFEAGCEPVYIEGRCCPSYFICPDEVKSITAPTKPGKCLQSVDQGEGNEQSPSFYFNPKKNVCDIFTYKGNGGNDNRFKTLVKCLKECGEGYDTCDLEPEAGNCYAHFTRVFYNKAIKRCEPFVYGGCGGNANNFDNVEQCEMQCKNAKDRPKCVFGGMEFEKGQHLILNPVYPKPCVEVKCVAPPHLTFIHRNCPKSPAFQNCRTKYSFGKCCPKYVCDDSKHHG